MISHLPSKLRLPGIREVLKRHGGCSGCGNGVTELCEVSEASMQRSGDSSMRRTSAVITTHVNTVSDMLTF